MTTPLHPDAQVKTVESGTPRTDAEAFRFVDLSPDEQGNRNGDYVPADLARTLERELAAWQAYDGEIESLKAQLESTESSLASAARELAEARDALRPFVYVYRKHAVRYEKIGSDWFDRMPGAWPITLIVTMDDGRAAIRALHPSTQAPAQIQQAPDDQPKYSHESAVEYAKRMGLPTKFPL